MVIDQDRSRRKPSGGRIKTKRLKRKVQSGRHPTLTRVNVHKTETLRTIGGGKKTRLLSDTVANIGGKKVTITSVVESAANRNYVRANVIVKGTIIETELGKAKVSSRPGQHGSIQAVLIK